MCNACHNVCCGSDEFFGCGCDGCDEPDCWSEDEDLYGDNDDFDDYDFTSCCAVAASAFRCEELAPP